MTQEPASDTDGRAKTEHEFLTQYFVTELEMLHNRAMQQEQITANKVNFFLVTVSAVLGAVLFLSDFTFLDRLYLPLVTLIVAIASLMGLATFGQTLDLSRSTTWYYRRAGRIRRWFVDEFPDSAAYMPFGIGDDTPQFYVKYARFRGMEPLIMILNSSLLAGLVCLIGLTILTQGDMTMIDGWLSYAGVAFIGIFALAFFIQWWWARRFFLKRERSEGGKKVLYPKDSFSFDPEVIRSQKRNTN